jgi:hypothetical protein
MRRIRVRKPQPNPERLLHVATRALPTSVPGVFARPVLYLVKQHVAGQNDLQPDVPCATGAGETSLAATVG